MEKWPLLPQSPRYSVQDGQHVIEGEILGGLPLIRLDRQNEPSLVRTQFMFTGAQFEQWRRFYNITLAKGSKKFLIDLITDNAEPVEHVAQIRRGVSTLRSQQGDQYMVTMDLWTVPVTANAGVQQAIAALEALYPPNGQVRLPIIFADLDELVNVDLPTGAHI